MIFNLVLQHCPKVLESLLKYQTKLDTVKEDMDGVAILLILRDIRHKHNSLVQSTLLYVKTLLEWTLTFQGKHDSNTDYYTVFLSRTKMIRSYDGEPGIHNRVYQKHLAKLLSKNSRTMEKNVSMGSSSNSIVASKELIRIATCICWK